MLLTCAVLDFAMHTPACTPNTQMPTTALLMSPTAALPLLQCHEHFEMEFGPHVTFVSGKSLFFYGITCAQAIW